MSLSTRRSCAWRWTSSATSLGWAESAIAGAGAAFLEAPKGSASRGAMGAKRLTCALRAGQTATEGDVTANTWNFGPVAARSGSALPSLRGFYRPSSRGGAATPQGRGRLQWRPHRVLRDAHRLCQRVRLAAHGGGEERPRRGQPGRDPDPRDDLRA